MTPSSPRGCAVGDHNYWRDCISEAAEACGLTLTIEQLQCLAEGASGGHECYGMAFYSPPAGEYLTGENERLRRELRAERDKIGCADCGGTGRLRYNSGPWAVNTGCSKCNGEGKHAP